MNMIRRLKRQGTAVASASTLTLIIGLGLASCTQASEQNATEQNATEQTPTEQNVTEQTATEQNAGSQDVSQQNAKALLKGMSDYLAAQKVISLNYDTVHEVVTKEGQKLQIATSGTVVLNRPDKIRNSRKAGFADTEMTFDGKTLTLLGKGQNAYIQAEVPGTVDTLIDQLRDKFQRPLPGADLLLQNVYDALMTDVTDVKDLGSGVIGGTECDHLAFRAKETDWQIWIAQGKNPYPCKYVITSKGVDQAPQFTITIRDWKAGAEVPAADFNFTAPAGAKKLDAKDLQALKEASDLPENYRLGETK
jgi:hypothetical protein